MGDSVAAAQKLEEFYGIDHSFSGSREGRFLENLKEAAEGYNTEAFSEHCYEYDKVSKLDPWKTSVCLRIKKSIEGGIGGEGGGGDGEEVDLT